MAARMATRSGELDRLARQMQPADRITYADAPAGGNVPSVHPPPPAPEGSHGPGPAPRVINQLAKQ
jgi:hypothetical protein